MSRLEEKLLDGPKINYCDADDDDIRQGDDVDENHTHKDGEGIERHDASSLFRRPNDDDDRLNRLSKVHWRSAATNTGPKGVIEDEKKHRMNQEVNDLEQEFQDLLKDNDPYFEEYKSKMLSKLHQASNPNFGRVYRLSTGEQLLDAIDKENKVVTVIVYLYGSQSRYCKELDQCLDEIASDYKNVKFVTLDVNATGLSDNFRENGVPALLVYKGGNQIKSFVQLDDSLGKNIDTDIVREFFIDNDLVKN